MSAVETTQVRSLGRYNLIASLGAGGMANVYLAVAAGFASFNKLLVLKTLRQDATPDFVHMFLDEARLSARFNHPNIVQAYEVGDGTVVNRPSCAAAAGMSASAIIQLIPKSWSSPDGGQVLYALNLSNGVQWQIKLRDGNNNVLAGTPAARAIANVFCYFA
jgi:serine/threonine protein kinase